MLVYRVARRCAPRPAFHAALPPFSDTLLVDATFCWVLRLPLPPSLPSLSVGGRRVGGGGKIALQLWRPGVSCLRSTSSAYWRSSSAGLERLFAGLALPPSALSCVTVTSRHAATPRLRDVMRD